MLSVKDIHKNFGPFEAVKGISFDIKKGEVVGLLGPNGAGKTTTMRMMTGFYVPTSGSILFNDLSVDTHRQEVQKNLGYLPESASSYTEMLVSDFLHFVAKARGVQNSDMANAMEKVVVSTSLQKYYYRPISHLSKGYRQRVGLAATLIHDPDILILDEPTAGLDPNQIIEIQNLIRDLSKEKTIILSTHILKEVEAICQRCIIMNEGNLVLDKSLSELHQVSEGLIKLTVKIKGQDSSIVDVLKQNFSDSNNSVSIIHQSPDTVVQVVAGSDAPEKVFNCVVQHNGTLLELTPVKENLEEIFNKLTTVPSPG